MKKSFKVFSLFGVAASIFGCSDTATKNTEVTAQIKTVVLQQESVQLLGTDRDDTLIDLAQNEKGEFAVTGTTDGPIDGYPNRLSDAFVAKYDSAGNKLWVVRFGTPQDEYATAVAINEVGEVWVAGDTYGGMEGNVNKGEKDGFLAKFSATGVQQWIVHISTEVVERARGLAVDSRGVATVVGTTYGEFPGFSHEGKSREAWITQIDGSGKQLWLQEFGSDQADTIVDVSVDEDGNSTFCGYTDSVIGQEFFGVRDAFIGKFTSAGEKEWIYQFGTTNTDICYGQWVDESGEIFAVGVTEGAFEGNSNLGGQDSWILKLSSNGQLLWVTQVGTKGEDGLSKVTTNSAGLVIAGGVTTGDVINPSPIDRFDAVLYVLDQSGQKILTQTFGTQLNDSVNGLAVTKSQQLIIAGTSGGGILGSVGLGDFDVFISRFKELNGQR